MSVQSQIDRINQNVANTYAVLEGYGATMPTEQNSDNLAATAATVIAAKIEPADDDMPKVFLTGDEFSDMTTEKNEVNMELDYRSKTDSFHAFIAIKFQGSTSLRYDKKNFTVKLFDDEAHATKQKHLFRDWKYAKNKFVLKANYIDHSHARNIMGANLWNEVVASRSDYSNLPEELRNSPQNGAIDGFPIKLYVNGTYQGVYTWNIGKDDWMWGMDEDNANHYLIGFGHNSDGEFKLRPYNFRALWNGVGTDGSYVEIEIGTSGDALTTSVNNLISFVMNNDGSAFRNGIGTYLDVQSAIDYYIHQYVICGLDGLAKNILLGTYDGKKWYCGAYDMDSTFGLYWNGSKFVSAQYKCPEDYQEKFSLLWERLESNFWSEIKTRYAELRKTVYSIGNMFTHFERFMDTIGLDLYAEDLTIYPNIPNGSTNNIKQLRNYIRDRLTYCDQQITNGIPGTGVVLSQTELTINTEAVTLKATVKPSNTTDTVLWLTSDASVATVNDGVVTPVSDGSCTIRAKCGSGYGVCEVTVSTVDEPTYTNLVPTAEERVLTGDSSNVADFSYDGVGYANGYRLSSSGYIKTQAGGIVTGFIPAKGGDVVRIGGIQWAQQNNANNYLYAYKSDYTPISGIYGQKTSADIATSSVIDYDTPLSTVTLANNPDIAFIRIGCYNAKAQNGANLIVTVNEEIV